MTRPTCPECAGPRDVLDTITLSWNGPMERHHQRVCSWSCARAFCDRLLAVLDGSRLAPTEVRDADGR